MRGAVLHGPGDLRLEARPEPTIGPDEVLIEVAYVGICGSDLHLIDGMALNVNGIAPGPRVIGHELSGTVLQVGAAVTSCRPGDRVCCIPWTTCGHCAYCRRGGVNHCTNKRVVTGAFADRVVAPQGAVYQVPASVSLRRAALAEPLSCCVWAIDLAGLRSGETAVVIGAGTVGLLLLLLARRGGAAQVIVSEPNPYRRALAEQLGADLALDPRATALIDAVAARTEGLGADVAFEAVGRPATVQSALDVVRHGGTVVVVGVSDPDATMPFSPFELYRRELTLRGCFTRRLSFDRAVAWLPNLDLDPVITHVLPLDGISEGVELARQGRAGKVLLAPNGTVE